MDVPDGKLLKRVVDVASLKVEITKVIGDGTYDSRENFRFLTERGIESISMVSKGFSTKAMNWAPRKLRVIQQLRRRPMAEKACLQIKIDGRISHVITQKDIQKILHQVDEYSQRIPLKTLDLQPLHRNYTLKD